MPPSVHCGDRTPAGPGLPRAHNPDPATGKRRTGYAADVGVCLVTGATGYIGGLSEVNDVDMSFITHAYKRGHLLKDGRLTRRPA